MIDTADLTRRIQAALPDAQLQVQDLTGGGDHYRLVVTSAAFTGVSAVGRHRMVYAPLKDILGGALHALALQTRTPDEP